MKRIYLVKEYKKDNKNEFDWIQLNRVQFNSFLKTDEAKGRCFMTLPEGIDSNTDHIVIEIDQATYKDYLPERSRKQYLNRWRKKKKISVISLEKCADISSNQVYGDDFEFLIEQIDRDNERKLLYKTLEILGEREGVFVSDDLKQDIILHILRSIPIIRKKLLQKETEEPCIILMSE